MSAAQAEERVTTQDIETKPRQIRGQFEQTTESARPLTPAPLRMLWR